MSTDLSIQSLGDAVRDKVRKAMMDSIPDEAIHSLIKNEFDMFFKDEVSQYRGAEPSPFKKMIREEVHAQMRARVSDIIKGELDTLTTTSDAFGGVKLVGELVQRMAPTVLESVMANIAQQTLYALKNQRGY